MFTAPIQAMVDAITATRQSVLDVFAAPVEAVVDAVATAFQRGGSLVMAERFLMRGATVEAGVDPIATFVETVFDVLAACIQAVVDAVTAVVQALLHTFARIGGHRHAGRQQQHSARERNGQGMFHRILLVAGQPA
jgi:ABC-type proline/glycine betaine transport system permease subunit